MAFIIHLTKRFVLVAYGSPIPILNIHRQNCLWMFEMGIGLYDLPTLWLLPVNWVSGINSRWLIFPFEFDFLPNRIQYGHFFCLCVATHFGHLLGSHPFPQFTSSNRAGSTLHVVVISCRASISPCFSSPSPASSASLSNREDLMD